MSVQLFHTVLSDLNSDVSSYAVMKKDSALNILLSYAFDASKRMILPEGTPEFKPDRAPLFMSPSTLRYECKRLYIFVREDLTDKKRQTLFVQMLESLHPVEAEVLCLVKDQKLHVKFSNLTHEWAASVGLRCPVSKEEQKSDLPESVKEDVVEVESTPIEVAQGSESNTTPEEASPETAQEVKETKKKGKK